MTTVKTYADQIGVHARTVKRWGARMGFKLSLNDPIPEELKVSINGGKSLPAPEGKADGQNYALSTRTKPAKKEKVDYVHNVLFGNQVIIIVAAATLIGVDSLSFAWIAWNTYISFQVTAAIIFACAGMAVGYSAIKNFVGYEGRNGNEWMWGFGVFQFLLHLCAMEVLGDWSFFLGKIVISMGLPLATVGLAIALRKSKA